MNRWRAEVFDRHAKTPLMWPGTDDPFTLGQAELPMLYKVMITCGWYSLKYSIVYTRIR